MSIFNFSDYRPYLRQRIEQMPRKGRGQVLAIADALSVHSSLVSQVLKGRKDFTLEQGQALCAYLGLTGLEEDYLQTLIHLSRAGTPALRAYYNRRLAEIKRASLDMSKRLEKDRELTEEEKARFYSNWMYSAVRLMTAIKGADTIDALSEHLAIPLDKLGPVLQFLTRTGLLIEKNGRYEVGPQKTYVNQSSPYVVQHHGNWRLRGIHRAPLLTEQELMFTCTVALSTADFERFREELAVLIKRFYALAKDSPSEQLACLNIDWFKVAKYHAK